MSVPSNTVGELLIEQHLPYLTPDLEDYLNAIGSMFNEIDAYVGILAEEDGWSALLSSTRCPANGLNHLAMYVGERLPSGLDEVMAREWIADAPNQRRGTMYSIVGAAQRTLTGTRLVSIQERSGGGANPEDYLTVRTYTSQTPNPAAVLADLRTVVPADIALDYAAASGQSWNQLKATSPTWDAVKSGYASWNEVATKQFGYAIYSRPRPL
jgi:hypothetical protein